MSAFRGLLSTGLLQRNAPKVMLNQVRYDYKMNDPLDHATGIEKRELMQIAAGNTDPFDLKGIKRGPGTKDQPNCVPSAFDSRLIGCLCEPDDNSISYMWLYKDCPKRCGCGHWFLLVDKAPV